MRGLWVVAVLVLGGCAAQTIPDAESQGAMIFQARCSACHALPHPKRLDAEGWAHMVAVMERRMKERGMPPLSQEEKRKLMDYLERHAR